MHELSVCQNMLQQIEAIVAENNASMVYKVCVQIGPLSGVEPLLLSQAFPIATAGSVAESAELVIETLPVVVRCQQCGTETSTKPNKLVCGKCGDWRTTLVSGDEMILSSVELDKRSH